MRDWAWRQSAAIRSAEELEEKLRLAKARFPTGAPRVDWTGYLLSPVSMEFFYPHPRTALHERLIFRRRRGESWKAERLTP